MENQCQKAAPSGEEGLIKVSSTITMAGLLSNNMKETGGAAVVVVLLYNS